MADTNVEIRTPDGTCDAAFIHPATGSHKPDAERAWGKLPALYKTGLV